jgi:hypothetical protein
MFAWRRRSVFAWRPASISGVITKSPCIWIVKSKRSRLRFVHELLFFNVPPGGVQANNVATTIGVPGPFSSSEAAPAGSSNVRGGCAKDRTG